MNPYKLSDIAQNEMKEFARYTIESRAIPNMIDGLKPVQRFYLYSSIKNTAKDFKKVSAVSGVVSDYGYNHGEASAAGAGQLMAAEWNNNICLVEGRGSFGTRQVQEAGAARYVYTRLHSNFHKYIKDIDLSPLHIDPEHEPPAFYIPVIPLVLANGTRGIATGFATNILPRSEKDLVKACKEYIQKGKISKRLVPSFPHFRGKVEFDPNGNRWLCTGMYDRPTPTKIVITEIPYGYDRESYVKILDKLEEDGDILGYEDQCSAEGFKFEVKLKNATAKTLNADEKVNKKFKLEKPMPENITVIDSNNKLKEFDDERDLIKEFCDYRLQILDKRIQNKITDLTEECRWLNVKMQFIKAVLDDEIIFKGKGKDDVAKQILNTTSAIDKDTDRLLRMNIMSLTMELIKDLMAELKAAKDALAKWKSTTPNEQFVNDLEFK